MLKRIEDIRKMRASRVALVGGDQNDPVAGIGKNDRVRHTESMQTGVVIGLNLTEFEVMVDWDDCPPSWVAPGYLIVTERGEL